MNLAATEVLNQLPDIFLAYGQSDEYSFLLHPSCELYERRESKLVSTVVSVFSTAYALFWPQCFPGVSLTPPYPSFDGRAVAYPTLKNLRDYLCWRQADCHINNLYNTTFWTLVEKGGMSRPAAERELSGTFSADKNEILFARFGINYNEEPAIFRKGSVVFRDYFRKDTKPIRQTNESLGQAAPESHNEEAGQQSSSDTFKIGSRLTTEHTDIMRDEFWNKHPWLLESGNTRKRTVRSYFAAADSG